MDSLTNGDIFESVTKIGVINTVKYLKKTFECQVTENTIRHNIERLIKKHANLKKSRHRVKGENNLEIFLKKMYEMPSESRKCDSAKQKVNEVLHPRLDPFHATSDDPKLIAMSYKTVAMKYVALLKSLFLFIIIY
jgi:hypothetical protein